MSRIDIVGVRFGRLVVQRYKETVKRKAYWVCLCDCGRQTVVSSNSLSTAQIKSCGCLLRTRFPGKGRGNHGMYGTRIYRIWDKVIQRCCNANSTNYKRYGGAGISVCERWHYFENFYEDMKDGYADDLSIDRYPNQKGNYEPGNCRWATRFQQNRNKINNIYLEFNGESMIYADWGKRIGITESSLRFRLTHGWSVEKAVTTPSTQLKKSS